VSRIFIGDVHGCVKTLKALIEKINPTKEDIIRFTGDLIDRGPSSKQVLDFIISKQLEGYFWESILGNHEAILLEWDCTKDEKEKGSTLKWWIGNGGYETIRSFGGNIGDDYISWIKNLPEYIIEEDIILVHAGLNFLWTDPIKHMIDEAKEVKLKYYSPFNHLWIRTSNIVPSALQGKILITGHTVTSFDEIKNHSEFHIKLDNGCFTDLKEFYSFSGCGMLVAYNLDKDEFITQVCIDGE
jgi:serine/threonine protein phosphatase 1